MPAGDVELEFGVPIPGRIVPESDWTRTAIKRLPEKGPLDWETIFGRRAPLVVDLGCGNGRFTLQSALGRPGVDHIAIDVLPVVIRYATRRANQRGIPNARFAVKDAQTFVRSHLAAGSVDEIHLYHPQPFHDPRKRHLRLVTPRFLSDVRLALRTGGAFFVQTDNPDYWAYMTQVLPEFFEFAEQIGPWPDALDGRSRREILARRRGLQIFRGRGIRRDDRSDDQLDTLIRSLPEPKFRSRGPWCDLDRDEERGSGGD